MPADRIAGADEPSQIGLTEARAGYAFCHLVAGLAQSGDYNLVLKPFSGTSQIETSLYRKWLLFVPRQSITGPR